MTPSDTSGRQSPPPAVVLVRPQEEGNIGATARAMANMGLERLLLVEPAPRLGPTARAFAVGATHVLDTAERFDTLAEAVAPFERLVGTSSTRQRQFAQRVVTARELPAILAAEDQAARTAIVFGPEASGLTRDELALCDPLVVVPCSPVQPTLNLSQAVLLITYELAQAAPAPLATDLPAPDSSASRASVAVIERLLDHADELLHATGFERDDTYPAVMRDLRRLAARAALTEREVQILHGICRRVLGTLAALDSGRAHERGAVGGDRTEDDRGGSAR